MWKKKVRDTDIKLISMNFYQIVLPIFTIVFLLQVFVVRSLVLWKKTGKNPFMFSKSDGAHDYAGRVYKKMVVGTWVSIAMFSFFDSYYKYLLPIWYLDIEWLRISGVALVLIAFIWIVVAQFQMKNSWRIGIDYKDKTELIDSGLFGVSRNPIFLGVIISYIGTFLIIPNLLSFCIMVLTIVILQVQVRLEEAYLIDIHKDVYVDYKNKVRRWI